MRGTGSDDSGDLGYPAEPQRHSRTPVAWSWSFARWNLCRDTPLARTEQKRNLCETWELRQKLFGRRSRQPNNCRAIAERVDSMSLKQDRQEMRSRPDEVLGLDTVMLGDLIRRPIGHAAICVEMLTNGPRNGKSDVSRRLVGARGQGAEKRGRSRGGGFKVCFTSPKSLRRYSVSDSELATCLSCVVLDREATK